MKTNIYEQFLEIALTELSGEWIWIGGSLLHVLNISDRVTLDIDIVPRSKVTNNHTLILMEIAAKLGLPPETINMAGQFYLTKIKNWEEALVVLGQSESCTIYRPNATLFILMKLERLSESDRRDIDVMLEYAHHHNEAIDVEKIEASVQHLLSTDIPQNKATHYEEIRNLMRRTKANYEHIL